MQAQYETTASIPALTDNYIFCEMDVRVTVDGEVDGYDVEGQREWDFDIVAIEGWAIKSYKESHYQDLPRTHPLHDIIKASIKDHPSFGELAINALNESFYSHKRAAE